MCGLTHTLPFLMDAVLTSLLCILARITIWFFYYYLYILDCISTNSSVTVSDFVQSNFVQVLLSMVCLRSYSCYCHGLFMLRGHKVATLWPKASLLNGPYGSIESPLSWFLLCIALEALGVAGFNPRKHNTPKLGDLVCKEQFTNIA